VTRAGRLVIDDPKVQRRLIEAVDSYTAIYRKGCTPPDSVTWDGYGNNAQFLAHSIVMTPNQTLSITNALKTARPDDYYDNALTIDWPVGAYGQPLAIETALNRLVVFKNGEHVATATEFVRFLVGEGWLAHYLDFAGDRLLPPMPKLLDAPFWLDPGDPHRMRIGDPASDQAALLRLCGCLGRLAAHHEVQCLGGSRRTRCRGRHQPRAGGRGGDRPDQADSQPIAAGGEQRSRGSPAYSLGRGFVHTSVEATNWRPRAVAAVKKAPQVKRAGGCRRPGARRGLPRTARPGRARPGRRAPRPRYRSRFAPRAA
jgi:hypothetical protein